MDTDLVSSLDVSDYRKIGVMYAHHDEHEKAARFFSAALQIDPDNADDYSNLGAAQINLKDYVTAKKSLSEAIRLDPKCAYAWMNCGTLENRERHFAEGRFCLEMALKCDPPWTDLVWNMLAMTSQYEGRFEQAEFEYARAVQCNPNSAASRMSLGIIQMLLLNWDEGLPNYESRLVIHRPAWPTPRIPIWDGGKIDLAGKRLLVVAEQGTGDTFMFARYGDVLRHLFVDSQEISLFVSDELRDIMQKWPGWDHVYSPKDGELPTFDLQVALMSLPYLLRQNGFLGFIVPPVKPTIPTWHNKKLYSVGLCWRGNPGHKNDSFRSLRIFDLESLFDQDTTGYAFRSLQYAPTEKELDICNGLGIETPALDSWIVTAESVAELDLVITCDTSIAHLSASLGKPTWILLPANPDWRWRVTADTSTWYPSVSLFRQKQLGDWNSPIQQIRSLL